MILMVWIGSQATSGPLQCESKTTLPVSLDYWPHPAGIPTVTNQRRTTPRFEKLLMKSVVHRAGGMILKRA